MIWLKSVVYPISNQIHEMSKKLVKMGGLNSSTVKAKNQLTSSHFSTDVFYCKIAFIVWKRNSFYFQVSKGFSKVLADL